MDGPISPENPQVSEPSSNLPKTVEVQREINQLFKDEGIAAKLSRKPDQENFGVMQKRRKARVRVDIGRGVLPQHPAVDLNVLCIVREFPDPNPPPTGKPTIERLIEVSPESELRAQVSSGLPRDLQGKQDLRISPSGKTDFLHPEIGLSDHELDVVKKAFELQQQEEEAEIAKQP